MPPQTVAAATLNSQHGYGICPKCLKDKELFELAVSVTQGSAGRVVSEELCISCLCGDVAPMIKLKLSDVMDTKGPRRAINKTARRREQECAEDIGGRTTPASGSGISKGDARNDDWMVDDKFTGGTFFKLSSSIMTKALADLSA